MGRGELAGIASGVCVLAFAVGYGLATGDFGGAGELFVVAMLLAGAAHAALRDGGWRYLLGAAALLFVLSCWMGVGRHSDPDVRGPYRAASGP